MAKSDNGWRERLSHQYRLVVRNDESLEEVAQYRLSLKNLYIFISASILLLGTFIVLLIIFTPLKTLIPGYGELTNNTVLIQINEQLNELDQTLDAQQIYMNSFQKMMTADEIDDISATSSDTIQPSASSLLKAMKAKNYSTNKLYLYPPVKGLVSAEFDPDKGHLGIDILAKKDSPVLAIADGKIIVSDWNEKTGNTIGIQHANNLLSFYKHNSKLLKDVGAAVKAGEAIAVVGNTGSQTTGPHLHFEMWKDGQVINPNNFIEFNSL